ncbi:MAG: hypothetical protein Fur0032_24950 [Terrimicrobiaceae bacterium]
MKTSDCFMVGYARRPLLKLLLLLAFGISLFAADPAPLRRGSWAAFTQEAQILSANDAVIRTAEAGEVVRIKIARDGWAEVSSSVPDLPGGKVKAEVLRPATAEENQAWVARGAERLAQAAADAAPLDVVPPSEDEAALEAAEPPASQLPSMTSTPAPDIREPIMGWFAPGSATRVHSLVRATDGAIYLCGSLKLPITSPGARGWSGPLPMPGEENPEMAFLAKIAPDLKTFTDLVVFAPGEVGELHGLKVHPTGEGIWAAAASVGETIGGKKAPKANSVLLHFSPDLKSIVRALPILPTVKDFALDAANRPVVLDAPKSRTGGAFLTRYFGSGFYERQWPEAPDGATRRLKLDFSSPALAEGPFALWSQKSETLPDFPTPLAPWGSEPNAGQPITWTNVAAGKNPIRGANLMPEALALDREGNILVSGTIPFHMGHPDFDPFLLKFSPSGKLLWNNCFLNGLLSEPDQKTQALSIDPSNGDVLISYWQHGNNKQTLLVSPDGWLTRFTGTNGNIKVTWIGRVDAVSGKLKNATLLYSQMPESKNPKWPDLNSVGLNALAANSEGWVFAAGGTTIALPTTSHAMIPHVPEYGEHPFICVIEPDLTAPRYSTYLSTGQGRVSHMALASDRLAILAGTHKTEGTPLTVSQPQHLTGLTSTPPTGEPEATFLAIIPIPADPASWSFSN